MSQVATRTLYFPSALVPELSQSSDAVVHLVSPPGILRLPAPYRKKYNNREVLHSEFRNYFRNAAAAVEKVVELSEVWWRNSMVPRKWIFGSFMFGSAYLNTKSVFFMFVFLLSAALDYLKFFRVCNFVLCSLDFCWFCCAR